MPTTDVNVWASPFLLVGLFLIAMAFVVGSIFRRRSTLTIASLELAQQEQARNAPWCVCGEEATHPSPILERSRGDVLRSYFGAPPRYKRTTDPVGTPAYCRFHAHYADLELDKFVYDLRAEQAATNATIGARAANFEQEGLPRKIADSLTEEQKRAKRTSNVTRLNTGT